MEQTNQQQLQNRILKQFNSSFDFKRLLGTLVSKWYWFVFALTLTLTAGYLYLRYTTPIYAMYSSILIDESESNVGKKILNTYDNAETGPNLYNEIYIIRSQDLIARVVDSLDMNVRYWVVGRVVETEIYDENPIRIVFDSAGYRGSVTELNIRQIVDGQFEISTPDMTEQVLYDTWITRPYGRFKILYNNGPNVNKGYLNTTEFIVRIESPSYSVGRALGMFQVYPSDGRTSLLELYYEDNIQQRGVDFLNCVITFYQRKELENINRTAERTRDFINQRKAAMIEDLKNVDSLVEDIKVDNEIVDVQTQTGTFLTGKTAADQKIDEIMMKKQAVQNLKSSMQTGAGSRNQVIAGVGVEDPFLAALIAQYNTAVQQKEELERNTAPLNPMLQEKENEVISLKRRIVDAAEKVDRNLDISLQNAYRNEQEYAERLKNAPTVDRNIKDVKRDYNVLENIYLYLYQKGVENEISVYAASNKSKIVVVPYASGAPIKPVSKNIYIMMFMLGMFVPATFLVVREMLNNRVINENDIEALTTIPIVGTVARVLSALDNENTIVVGPHIRTGVAEQFRLIRANLEFMSAAKNSRVYMVTSSMSGEGKSFVSINLGLTMTLAKKRVIIMEFDLRKPKISQYLGLNNEGGISGYLAGMVDLDRVVKASGVHENLYIANCGPIPPNPGELLVLEKTSELIQHLQEMFDVVIIDTAPIGLVSDALILSQHAGINLFIVRQSYTMKDQVRMFDVVHKDGKINNPAIIFNGVEYLKKYGYGYGSGYGYGYSYGNSYGYYEENAPKKKKKPLTNFFLK